MKNDDRVKAPCPECRQMILPDRMGKHLRKAHRYDPRRTRPYDDIRQGIGRVVVAESAWGLPVSRDRAPVTTGKNIVGATGTLKPLRRIKALTPTNPPKKVFRAHPPAESASKIDERLRYHDKLSMDRFVAASRRDAPKGFAPGWASMKYPSYSAYLHGPEWKEIRARVLKRDGYACCMCGWCYSDCKSPMSASDRQLGFWKGGFILDEQDRRLEVHHEDYSLPTMSGETLAGLKTLCDKCHRVVTRKDRSGPRTFRRDEKTLFDQPRVPVKKNRG